MAVRVKDIAERLGVSATTVSLVLNNKPGAGGELRDKILRTARELGYRQQRPAEAGSICLLHIARHGRTLNRDHDVFIADYIEGLSHAAKQAGFSLEIMTFRPSPIEQILDAALHAQTDGFVVLGTELSGDDVESFRSLRRPLAFIDTYHEFLNFDFVDMNNEDSIFLLLDHLRGMGHRTIGFVKGAVETRNFRLREEGYVAGMAKLGLDVDRSLIYAVDQTFHGAYDDMKRIIAGSPRLPTALVCANDILASGCLKAFSDAGLLIPEDISIVGFDDLPLSAVMDPPLTTIQVSKAQIGRMAIQLLVARIRGDADMPSVKVLIGGKLIERRSVRRIGDGIQPS
ncbi:MAG TPA: LacI family DNA-binding transcriptional regulator [Rectinemataceae bacterium]|nr:LacI family DNA-binding transcriptional regulator [Rectinemataceae bacterium]